VKPGAYLVVYVIRTSQFQMVGVPPLAWFDHLLPTLGGSLPSKGQGEHEGGSVPAKVHTGNPGPGKGFPSPEGDLALADAQIRCAKVIYGTPESIEDLPRKISAREELVQCHRAQYEKSTELTESRCWLTRWRLHFECVSSVNALIFPLLPQHQTGFARTPDAMLPG
jgi:hypothetical protein